MIALTGESDERGPVPSMWYCPTCEHWVGRCRDECSCGRDRPRLPLYVDDLEHSNARYVTRRDRARAKVRRLAESYNGISFIGGSDA